MNEEKLRVLEMIEQGKISAKEGLDLLQTLEAVPRSEGKTGKSESRSLRVRVRGDKTNVNVNVPLSLVRAASKFMNFGMSFIPQNAREEMSKHGADFSQLDLNELVDLIDRGLVDEKLVDVEVEDEKEGHMKVEVYVD